VPAGPRFEPGDAVQVKRGIKDPDFPEFPLGGWSGVVRERDDSSQPALFLIEWDAFTREHIHPAFRVRADREGLDPAVMWLKADDLEPLSPERTLPEQPAALKPPPLRSDLEEDRIRGVFGLTADDPVPPVSMDALRVWHQYLSQHLQFPMRAEVFEEDYLEEGEEGEEVTVRRLAPIGDCDEEDGLLAETGDAASDVVPLHQVDAKEDYRDKRLVRDYGYWFTNCREGGEQPVGGPLGDLEEGGEESPTTFAAFFRMLGSWGALGAGVGAACGAILASVEGARLGLTIGAGIVGLLFYLVGSRFARMTAAARGRTTGLSMSALFSALVGGVLGGVLGVLAVAFLGSIPGAIAGSLLRRGTALVRRGPPPGGEPIWAFLGANAGGFAWAIYESREEALTGALYGALVGGAAPVLLLLVAVVALASMKAPGDGD
jgi:hypothetical protein